MQFKALSVTSVPYSAEQFAWLCDLRLPLFFGRVDVHKASIDLYTGHIMSRSVHAGTPRYARFEFSFEDELTFGEYETENGKTLRLRTGPPILRWSTREVSQASFLKLAYEALKKTIEIENQNLRLRAYRAVNWLEWTTNATPVVRGISAAGSLRGGEDLVNALRRAEEPYKHVLRNCIHAETADDEIQLHREMISYFRKHGVDPDPLNAFERGATETREWLQRPRAQ